MALPFGSSGSGDAFGLSSGGHWMLVVAGLACMAVGLRAMLLAGALHDRAGRIAARLFAAGLAVFGLACLAAPFDVAAGSLPWLAGLVAGLLAGAAVLAGRTIRGSGRPVDAPDGSRAAIAAEADRRRIAEEQVDSLEHALAATLASIDAGLIATDAAGNVIRLNAVAERITGWPQSEAIGRSYWEVFVRVDRPAIAPGQSVVDLLSAQGLDVGTTHRVVAVARDGTRTPVEVKGALRRLADGSAAGMLALIKDMTDIDRAEEDRHRLAAIVESSSDAIIGKTLDGRVASWNRAAAELFGYTEAEILGQPVQLLIPPERRAEEMEILASLFEGRVVPPFETVRVAKGGRRLELSVTISPIRDASGRIVGGSKIARDIAPQRKLLAALRDSEARLRFVLAAARVGDWELELETGAVSRSMWHDRCFGYETLQPQWTIATTFAHVHPEDRDAVALSYQRALSLPEDWRTEFRVVWPDGSVHWLSIHGSTRHGGADSSRMVGVVADVTEQRRPAPLPSHAH